jgi:hypothetical protein
MTEIAPGIHHWTARHPKIGADVSSYFLSGPRVLLNPMLPPGGLEWFDEHGEPAAILLTNRHHYRDCGQLVERFGCTVHAPRSGMHEFTHGEPVTPYDAGDTLPGGAIAHEVASISPDEFALEFPTERALAVADGVVRYGDGPLTFVPDHLMDDPPGTKAGLLEAFGRLCDLDFDHLLLAHGSPAVGDGREQLRDFVARKGA